MSTITNAPTLESLARDAMAKTNSPDEAADIILDELPNHPELNRAIAAPLVKNAVLNYIYHRRNDGRRALFMKASTITPTSAAASVTAIGRAILDTYLINDKPLGDCTGAEISAQMKMDLEQERGFRKKRMFLASLLKLVPLDEVARTCVTEDRAAMLMREAELQEG